MSRFEEPAWSHLPRDKRNIGDMLIRTASFIAFAFTAATANADALDDYILSSMKQTGVPAVVFGVFKDGKMLRSGAYGFANVELHTPANTDNVFEIGSVTKQFTATLILKLMEEGKLALDDRIDKYLTVPDPWKAVTIRQLLSHTSGIPDIEEIFGYDSYRNIYTTEQIIAVANSHPMDFVPGTSWHYSNTGYYLLALILEKIEGKSYDQILRTRILNPLGMTHTRQSDPTAVILNRAAGYMLDQNGVLTNRDAMQTTACLGAGTIVSCIADMAKWDSAINHHLLIKAESQAMMWQPGQFANYGFGWFTGDWRGHPSVEHSGGTAGFSCDYRRFQDLGISVMVFCNLYATSVENIEIRAVDAVYRGLSYVSTKPIKDDPATHNKLLKALANLIEGGDSSPYYTPEMWKRYDDNSRSVWKKRLAEMVSFELIDSKHEAAQVLGHPTTELYVYRMKTRSATVFVLFRLTADGLIALQTRIDY